MTYGPPALQGSTWAARLLKKAVGRTIEYVMSPAACNGQSPAGQSAVVGQVWALQPGERPPMTGCLLASRQSATVRACNAASNFSFAFWNVSVGFCTQIADSSTKCFAPLRRPASSTFSVAWTLKGSQSKIEACSVTEAGKRRLRARPWAARGLVFCTGLRTAPGSQCPTSLESRPSATRGRRRPHRPGSEVPGLGFSTTRNGC